LRRKEDRARLGRCVVDPPSAGVGVVVARSRKDGDGDRDELRRTLLRPAIDSDGSAATGPADDEAGGSRQIEPRVVGDDRGGWETWSTNGREASASSRVTTPTSPAADPLIAAAAAPP